MNWTFYLATKNAHKAREYEALLGSHRWCVRLPADDIVFPPETGDTFRENALAKALFLSRRYPAAVVLGEDSGLVVPFLGELPGVRSARFAGPGNTDSQNIEKLLQYLADADAGNRSARFVCDIAIVLPHGKRARVFEGRVHGRIAREPRGSSGFGYDPVFEIPRLGKTFAEMSETEKNRISHRARAFRKVLRYMERAV
jgi:XTP/dITP diphosphohydrolase